SAQVIHRDNRPSKIGAIQRDNVPSARPTRSLHRPNKIIAAGTAGRRVLDVKDQFRNVANTNMPSSQKEHNNVGSSRSRITARIAATTIANPIAAKIPPSILMSVPFASAV